MINPEKLRSAVVCIAAGKSQLLVIEKLKEMGLAVIAIDRDPDAPGFSLSDEKVISSTYEAEPITKSLKELTNRYQIIGIVCRSSGPPVITSAEICESLNIPGVPKKTAETVVKKTLLMSFCHENKIAMPKTISIASLDEIAVKDLFLPCVIKPSLSLVGKNGIRIIRDTKILAEAFLKAKECTVDGQVLIQEYCNGRDVGLIAVVKKGHLVPLAFLDELNTVDHDGIMIGRGFAIPSIIDESAKDEISGLARKIITLMDINTSPFLMSCRYVSGKGPILIEIHLDMGGDLILDELIPHSSESDLVKIMICCLLNDGYTHTLIKAVPSAVFYHAGDKLVTDRGFEIISRHKRKHLENDIIDMLGENYVH